MIKKIKNVLIWSADYRRLADWYINNLGFETVKEYKLKYDTGVLLNSGPVGLWIGKHSKVRGKNTDIFRHMIDFEVDSVGECFEVLKKSKIKIFAGPHQDPTSGKYVLTVFDADDNLVQLVGKK